MIFTIVGAIVLAIACVGTVLLAFRAVGKKVPKGVVPLVAGLSMAGFAFWEDYSWFGRAQGNLPEGAVVVSAPKSSDMFRPWSFIVPRTARFIWIDTGKIEQSPTQPEIRLAQLTFTQRYTPNIIVTRFFDCSNAGKGVAAGQEPLPVEGETGDRILEAVCGHTLAPA